MTTETEEKTAHTPGPWSIDTCGDPIIINGPEDGRAIVAWVPSAQDNPDEDWSPEELANARLIAAAPEMYELCKLFEKCMERIDGAEYDASYELAKVRAVLAKVEGGGA